MPRAFDGSDHLDQRHPDPRGLAVDTDPCDDDVTHALEPWEAREIVRRSGLEPTLVERAGDPAETIERIAREGDFDLIVVGSRGLWDEAERYMGGSVSEHVAAHARVTVVVAR